MSYIIFTFYIWGHWSTENLSKSPKITYLLGSRVGSELGSLTLELILLTTLPPCKPDLYSLLLINTLQCLAVSCQIKFSAGVLWVLIPACPFKPAFPMNQFYIFQDPRLNEMWRHRSTIIDVYDSDREYQTKQRALLRCRTLSGKNVLYVTRSQIKLATAFCYFMMPY